VIVVHRQEVTGTGTSSSALWRCGGRDDVVFSS
jgi:hypothetical protein